MNEFNISDELEKSSNNIFSFRKDEKKYLGQNLNKYYDSLFKKEKISQNLVEKYLYEFFNNIRNANFPLGHNYVSLELNKKNLYNSEDKDSDDIDFFSICENFFKSLNLYKSSVEIEEQKYV